MKITLLNSSYFPKKGGVENSLYFLAREVVALGYQAQIIAGGDENEIYTDEVGVKNFRYRAPVSFLKRSYYLFRILKSTNSDILISRSFYTTFIALLAKKPVTYLLPALYKNQNCPKKVGNGSFSYKITYIFNCLLERVAISKCTRAFVFSRSIQEQVKDIGLNRELRLCCPGVDSTVYSVADAKEKKILQQQYGIPQDKKILLCLGRIVRIKGFQYAIQAMKYLDDSFCLVIVGDGSYKKELIDLAFELEVDSKVYFFESTNDPQDFYKLSDLFLLTSIYEPFGQVILEAVSCGLKVVSFSNKLAEVDTATEEIFNGTETLSFQAVELTGLSLSKSICEAIYSDSYEYTSEYDAFIKKFSWKRLLNDLCDSKSF